METTGEKTIGRGRRTLTATTAVLITLGIAMSFAPPPVAASTNTAASPLGVTQAFVPGTSVGHKYSQSLSADGGVGTLTWQLASGTLPPGLTLSPDGTISGQPTKRGFYRFTVQVADTSGDVTTKTFRMLVLPTKPGRFDKPILVNGQLYTVSPGWTPIWYVEQVLKLAGVHATWQANPKRWDLTVDTTSGAFKGVIPHLLYHHNQGVPVYVNGTLVLHAFSAPLRDPMDGIRTTYMPVYFVRLVLDELGIKTTWNPSYGWDFTLPGVNG